MTRQALIDGLVTRIERLKYAQPERRASVVVDNNDPLRPAIAVESAQ